MPVTAINVRRSGTYVLLEACLPGRASRHIGVLLIDPGLDRCFLRLRPSFDDVADPDDSEVLSALADHLREVASDLGASAFLEWLEDTASNSVRISERQTVEVDAFSRVLERLYSENVEPVPVQPFQTHVPMYSLRAAAGSLGEEMASDCGAKRSKAVEHECEREVTLGCGGRRK